MALNSSRNSWIHVLPQSCHYTANYPSALSTVAYEMSRCHLENQGEVKIVLKAGAHHDYPAGECIEVPFGPPLTRWKKMGDAAAAFMGAARPFGSRQYYGAFEAIKGTQSVILIHNGPVAVSGFKKANPEGLVCLWAHNEFWSTYTRRELEALLAVSDRIICVSDYMANTLRAQLKGDSDKIRVVNNGVDTDRFKPAPRRVEEPIISFIGRVWHPKGPHVLLKAAQILAQGKHDFKVKIVGGIKVQSENDLNSYEKELRVLAEPLGEKVEFVTSVDRRQVVEEYQKASIFCVPSVWNDPCPLTVLEGMSCGLATVTTKRGGIPEMAADSALYYDYEDPGTLAQVLSGLLEDPSARRQWADKARARAEAMSWEQQYHVLLKALA